MAACQSLSASEELTASLMLKGQKADGTAEPVAVPASVDDGGGVQAVTDLSELEASRLLDEGSAVGEQLKRLHGRLALCKERSEAARQAYEKARWEAMTPEEREEEIANR